MQSSPQLHPSGRTGQQPPCLVCGGYRIERVFDLPSTSVRACRSCGFAFCESLSQLTAHSSGEYSVLTDAGYSDGLLALTSEKLARYDALATRRYAEFARLLGRSSFRLLEVGCGTAGMAPGFERLGVVYRGIDIDARMVQSCVDRGMTGVTRADVFKLEEGPFDVICASQLLEHITEPRRFVEKLAALLSPGGVVHVDVPNHNGLAGRVATLLGFKDRYRGVLFPHHAFAYEPRTLRTLFSTAFEVEVFDSSPPDATWGQGLDYSGLSRVAYAFAGALGLGSLIVALGTKRAGA